jgi:hypothetical protein
VLSKEKAYAAIITMAHMNDAHIIRDMYDTFGFPADKESVLVVTALVAELWKSYDFLESPKFQKTLERKSDTVRREIDILSLN